MVEGKRIIIFFDGVCSLCNSVVDFLIQLDKLDTFRYASLQGQTARELLNDADINELSTLIVHYNGRDYKRFEAVMLIVKNLSFPYNAIGLLSFIPNVVGDWFYSLISKNRYRLFGKRETCRLPALEERSKFLD